MRRPYTDLSNPPRLDAPIGTRFVRLCDQEVGDHRRNSAVRDSPVSGIRGRQSWSTVVHLEVFTNRATRCVAPTQIHRIYRA